MSERPYYFCVVFAQATVHLPPGAQIHDFFQGLIPYVNLNIRSIITETET